MTKINRILIANRGEIASRIISTCQKMDIETVAIFSESDKNAPYTKKADISIFIGESKSEYSYLDQNKIIALAIKNQCQAIHPGYGFLSENSEFAKKCLENNLIFIGPKYETIELMASKINAKEMIIANSIPVISGFNIGNKNIDEIVTKAEKIGFPILIKASLGGGGKGIRIVHQKSELEQAISSAKIEALHSFGDDNVFIEKYFLSAHHIEFQIFGDNFGNHIHLFERECSIQRRYQKIIEESPSPYLNDSLRNEMAKVALKIAKLLNYTNAGTIEFLVDNNNYYFMEMNTRLQVEHAVTESVTGIDLVQLQIKIAQNEKIDLKQEDIKVTGHAIEARIYTEDPNNNFNPSTGTILLYSEPQDKSIRIDSDLSSNSYINIFYDSMIAKVISVADNRQNAINKMTKALKNYKILGIKTNKQFLLDIFNNEDFIDSNYDTLFIEKNYQKMITKSTSIENNIFLFLIPAFLYNWNERDLKRQIFKNIQSGWRNLLYQSQMEFFLYNESKCQLNYNYLKDNSFQVDILEQTFKVELIEFIDSKLICIIDGIQYNFYIVKNNNEIYIDNNLLGECLIKIGSKFPVLKKESSKSEYKAPIPGEIIKINVKKDDSVKKGDALVVILSMKMENTIYAHSDGIVEDIFVTEKIFTDSEKILLTFKNQDII